MEFLCPTCFKADNFSFRDKKTGITMRYCRHCNKKLPERDFEYGEQECSSAWYDPDSAYKEWRLEQDQVNN